MNSNTLKFVGIVMFIILIANMILFAMRIISDVIFWGIIIFGAIFAYLVLPKLREEEK